MEWCGLDDLRQWLESNGFQIDTEGWFTDKTNQCNWYAYRRSEIPARMCECNEKPLMQIVVKPYLFDYCEAHGESVQVEVCGEAGGEWYKLMAYAMKPEELPDKLERVEKSLIAAWNALV